MSYVMKGEKLTQPMTAPDALRRIIEQIVAEHDDGSGYSRYGGDSILTALHNALAATPPASAERTLDEAWRDCEAALPEGWGFTVTKSGDGWYAYTEHAVMDEWDDSDVSAGGATPIEALDALRAAEARDE